MNRLAVFGIGILCGMALQILLIWLYACLKINDIDKK